MKTMEMNWSPRRWENRSIINTLLTHSLRTSSHKLSKVLIMALWTKIMGNQCATSCQRLPRI
ncbi:unnamed protein product [Hymenolepis diminuta]|uniref:Uncharacterized protein n=1 Tax=Hymenolepis diminuta TaxID=6216 RepID=A0A564XXD0_HYMDI|nr:unnamed protein product [Hymenolepis diminuta]